MSLANQITKLREERAGKVKAARAVLDKASAENRGLSPEEQATWDAMMATVDDLKKRIDNLEAQSGAERDAEEDQAREDEEQERAKRESEDSGDPDEQRDDDEEDRDDEEDDEEPRSIKLPDGRIAYLTKKGAKRSNRRIKRGGNANFRKRQPFESEVDYRNRMRRSTPEYRHAYCMFLMGGRSALGSKEMRALSADSDIQGNYMVAPLEFTGQLIKFLDNDVYIRSKATKYTVASAQALGAPSLDTDPDDADWTSELATGNEDSAMAFGKRELHPHPLAKRIKVSNKLIRAASISSMFTQGGGGATGPEALVQDRLRYKFGVTEEKAFLTGNGSGRPLGLFTASARGISTGRDVLTGSTTNYTADTLIEAKYTLKVAYWKDAEWIFHRDGVRRIRQLKDGMGQYLWQPGLNAGDPDRLLELPISISEYAPNTFTTGQYVGLLGVLKFYWIVDAETMQIQKLVELYAESNQVGYIARLELDGMPVLEEAFVRLKTS
jgi:HK97 family phage major capsid protein